MQLHILIRLRQTRKHKIIRILQIRLSEPSHIRRRQHTGIDMPVVAAPMVRMVRMRGRGRGLGRALLLLLLGVGGEGLRAPVVVDDA